MEWWNSAGGWLMAHNEAGSFHGPSAYTPDGPEAGPYSADDPGYDTYLAAWQAAIDDGEFDEIVSDTMEAQWTTI